MASRRATAQRRTLRRPSGFARSKELAAEVGTCWGDYPCDEEVVVSKWTTEGYCGVCRTHLEVPAEDLAKAKKRARIIAIQNRQRDEMAALFAAIEVA